MGVLDRFSLATVARDHWRSTRVAKTGEPDRDARAVLYGVPTIAGLASVLARWRLHDPSALLPAVSLLAGVLLAAVSQVMTLRARIADSPTQLDRQRLSMYFRDTVSATLLAAVAALVDAVVLGVIAELPRDVPRWLGETLTAIAIAITAYLILMFVGTVRRLYTTYLEAFEGGLPLAARQHLRVVDVDGEDDASAGG